MNIRINTIIHINSRKQWNIKNQIFVLLWLQNALCTLHSPGNGKEGWEDKSQPVIMQSGLPRIKTGLQPFFFFLLSLSGIPEQVGEIRNISMYSPVESKEQISWRPTLYLSSWRGCHVVRTSLNIIKDLLRKSPRLCAIKTFGGRFCSNPWLAHLLNLHWLACSFQN